MRFESYHYPYRAIKFETSDVSYTLYKAFQRREERLFGALRKCWWHLNEKLPTPFHKFVSAHYPCVNRTTNFFLRVDKY